MELTESNGKTLAAMPVFAYCYEDPLNLWPYKCTTMTHNAIVNAVAQKQPFPDLSRVLTLPEKLNLKLLDLPMELRKEVVNCLDHPNEDLPNWKHLAAELDVTEDFISSLERQYLDPQESPTTQLLYLMDAKMPEMNVSKFLQVLNKIGRQDIWRLLHNWLQEPETTDVMVT